MILPIVFRNVSYSVAGSSKYKGDLILTPEVIYYFPHTDVVNKRFLVTAIMLLVVLGPLFIVSATCILYVLAVALIVLAFTFPSFAQGLAVDMVSSFIKRVLELNQELKERPPDNPEQNEAPQQPEPGALALHLYPYTIILYPELWYPYPIILCPALSYPLILDIAVLMLNENQSFSSSLHAPLRFSKDKILRLSLLFRGLLIIETEFDMKNRFHIGILRKDILRKGLREGGFIS
jgi:hypothetical protein